MTRPFSLILLAYNQERFVEAAVEAALAQDYPNLQIVISDDCSTDATSSVIAATVGRYRGPHRVVTNRSAENRGLIQHLYDAVALSTGEIIVGATGDDLSQPERVTILAEAFELTGADAVYSSWEVIDDAGRSRGIVHPDGNDHTMLQAYFPGSRPTQIYGVGAAYRRTVFEAIRCPPDRMSPEDFFYTLMLAYRSRTMAYVDRPLVRYRQHEGSSTNRVGTVELREMEEGAQRLSRNMAIVLRYFLDSVESGSGIDPDYGFPATVDRDAVRAAIVFETFRSTWLEAGSIARLAALGLARSWPQIRWLLPRIGGLRVLRAAQWARGRVVSRS